MQLNDEDVDCVLNDGDWLFTVTFECSEKNTKDHLQCKQRRIFLRDLTFLRRLYLYLLVWFVIGKKWYDWITNTMKQKSTFKRVFLLLLYFRAMHSKTPNYWLVRLRWLLPKPDDTIGSTVRLVSSAHVILRLPLCVLSVCEVVHIL